jgi:hypothetical protein
MTRRRYEKARFAPTKEPVHRVISHLQKYAMGMGLQYESRETKIGHTMGIMADSKGHLSSAWG